MAAQSKLLQGLMKWGAVTGRKGLGGRKMLLVCGFMRDCPTCARPDTNSGFVGAAAAPVQRWRVEQHAGERCAEVGCGRYALSCRQPSVMPDF